METTTKTRPGRMLGVVKSVLRQGYAYITGDDGVDRFMHRSMLLETDWNDLRVDQRVEFAHADAVKGPRAVDVLLVPGKCEWCGGRIAIEDRKFSPFCSKVCKDEATA